MTRKDSNRTAKEIKAMIAGDGEFLRPMVKAVNQEFLEAEMAQAFGAENGERAEGRLSYPRLLHAQLDYPSRATSTVSSPRSVLIGTERSTAPPTRDCFGFSSALESLDTRVLFFQPSWPPTSLTSNLRYSLFHLCYMVARILSGPAVTRLFIFVRAQNSSHPVIFLGPFLLAGMMH